MSRIPLISYKSELILVRFSSERTLRKFLATLLMVLSVKGTELDEAVGSAFGFDDGVDVDAGAGAGHDELVKSPFRTRP